jgi:uncharacterized protein (DUF58 family)
MFEFLKHGQHPDSEIQPSSMRADSRPLSDPLVLLKQLEWTTIRRLDGQLQGDFRTLFRGAGLMLADLREYQAQDDVRHIDWNVTARMHTPYVREHLEEREITAWFLVDLTGSINFGSSQVTKRMLALHYVATLARLLTRHGNRVGAILYEGPSSVTQGIIPPRTGRAHILHLIHRMQNPNDSTLRGETNLNDLFKLAQAVIKRRSTVFVVSDFISVPGWEATLKPLANRHDVVAARLVDPMEGTLPEYGMLLVEDIETGEQVFIDSDDAGFRKRFAAQAHNTEKMLHETLEKSGVDCIELDTGEAVDRALIRFLQARKRKSQVRRDHSKNHIPSQPSSIDQI